MIIAGFYFLLALDNMIYTVKRDNNALNGTCRADRQASLAISGNFKGNTPIYIA